MADDLALAVRPAPDGVGTLLALKVVAGASGSGIVGLHGDRLKIKVAAAPEGGKANRALCALLARHLGVAGRDVGIATGASSPLKTIRIHGLPPHEVIRKLK